jgi:hypothetical protein
MTIMQHFLDVELNAAEQFAVPWSEDAASEDTKPLSPALGPRFRHSSHNISTFCILELFPAFITPFALAVHCL